MTLRLPLYAGALLVIQALDLQAQAPLILGESLELHSSILKESRTLFISKPAGYDRAQDRYPVLYLLDGEIHFSYVAPMVRFLAANDRIPEMIVVGLSSGTMAQRTRDLTPPSSAESDRRFFPQHGGAAELLAFIERELVPYIDRSYRTRSYKAVAGHSVGGLFAINTFITRPVLFNAYIAIDPTLTWNNGALVERIGSVLAARRDIAGDLYVTASRMSGDLPDAVNKLISTLKHSAGPALRWNFEWIDDQTHGSLPLPATFRALETIFAEWHLTDPLPLFDAGGVAAIHEHFRRGGRRCGYDRSTPPFTISLLAAALIKAGRLLDAGTVLLHDSVQYPPPWNQLDALARGYDSRGDSENARRFYSLSLDRNPLNQRAKERLAELESADSDRSR